MPAMLKDAVPFDQVRRALVIKLRHHGDVLLSAPVLSALQAQAPQTEIDALVYGETAEMLSGHPALSQLHLIEHGWRKLGTFGRLGAEWGLVQRLKARQYDLVIHLTEDWRGAWLCRLLGPRWSVAPKTGGRGKLWADSFTHFYSGTRGNPRHTVEANLDSLRRLGLQPTPAQRRVTLVPGREAEARVILMLRDKGLEPGRYAHIHAPSRWQFKCWTSEGWGAVVRELEASGLPVVLTAAPGESEGRIVADILAASGGAAVSLAGQLSLKEMAALSARAKLFLGVDSAPMHIAAAMDTPVVALFGPSGERHWGPWANSGDDRHIVVASDRHSCRPCGIDGCGGSKISDCLVQLPAERVIKAAHTLLAR